MNAAVIGAGIAGLRLAQRLDRAGVNVRVFDKARGPSGRLATRRSDGGQFDHGAQYFTARVPSFVAQVEDWRRRGVVARWEGKVARLEEGAVEIERDSPDRYVGTPRMSAIARDLADGLRADFSTRIVGAKRERDAWELAVEGGDAIGDLDAVLMAVPAPQAVPLLSGSPELAKRAEEVRLRPCHALMVRFAEDVDVEFDAAFVRSPSLGWIAHNASKPGRDAAPTWVLHSTADWSDAHLEVSAEGLRDVLLEALADALGRPLPETTFSASHRWLYARAESKGDGSPLWDAERRIGACGDWVQGDRVEDAFASAETLASSILA